MITRSLVSCSPAFPDVFKRCQQAKQTGVDIYFSLGLLQKGAARPLRPACCEDSRTGVCINLQQYRLTKMQKYTETHLVPGSSCGGGGGAPQRVIRVVSHRAQSSV